MAGRALSFKIFAVNLVRRGVTAAKRELTSLRRILVGTRAVVIALGRAFQWLQRQFVHMAGLLAVSALGVGVALRKAFQFERMRVSFATLFGDMEKARRHMEELTEFAARTPFMTPGIAKASKLLHTFSEGVMGGAASLRLIGDAAAFAQEEIESVAMWVGRAFSALKAGQPFGEASMRLTEMGIMSARARTEMERLQKAGASSAQIWAILRADLERFNGEMARASLTGEGLASTLREEVNLALAEFGDVFMADAKDSISDLIAWLGKLRADGTITEWAKRAREALAIAAQVAKALAVGGPARGKALEGLADILIGALEEGASAAVRILVGAGRFIGAAIAAGFDPLRNAAQRGQAAAQATSRAEVLRARQPAMTRAEFRAIVAAETESILKGMRAVAAAADVAGVEAAEPGKGLARIDTGLAALREAADMQEQASLMQRDFFAEERAEARETVAAKAQARADAAADAALKLREQQDLEAAETERLATVRAEIQKLIAGEFGAEALARTRAATPAASDLDDANEKELNALLKSLNSNIKKAAAEAEARAKRIENKQATLDRDVKEFQIAQLGPEEQKDIRRKKIADLTGQISKETDVEKGLDLQKQRFDVVQKLVQLEKTGTVDGQFARPISLGEVFTRQRGQERGARDPEEEVAENTRQILGVLNVIKDRGGLTP